MGHALASMEDSGIMDAQDTPNVRDNLSFIRKTMEEAGSITAVPGWGLFAAGALSVVAAAFNAFVTGAPWGRGPYPRAALVAWGAVLCASVLIVSVGMYLKSRLTQAPIRRPLLRRLFWCLCPSLFVGALLTGMAMRSHRLEWLPVIWLGCYGAAVTSGGLVSIEPVRMMGVCFLLAAAGAAASPAEMGLFWLAAGFGLLHMLYGAYIARRYHG